MWLMSRSSTAQLATFGGLTMLAAYASSVGYTLSPARGVAGGARNARAAVHVNMVATNTNVEQTEDGLARIKVR